MTHRRGTSGTAALAWAICLSQASCIASTTDGGVAQVTVRGTWSYVAVQAGQPVTTEGTLVLTQDSTVRFSGTLDASERDTRGDVRRVIGIVSGRTVDATVVDFDMVLDPTLSRHHTGEVHGDSLSGTWVDLTDRGVVASGTYHARRIRSP
ncbi:MAG TPA: hypothetical protein VLN49_20260 [Gemmatimonadaceae bacterium]|nr:hypothetical protein [Gemmatimonadaceae bacterium]